MKTHQTPEVDWSDGPLCKRIGQALVEEAARSHRTPPSGVKQRETRFRAEDGTNLKAMIYEPASPSVAARGRPLVVLIHGGGFCVGVPENEEITARNLVQAYGVVAVSIDYRHAPEHKFPCAVTDAWSGLKWAAANAYALGADPQAGFIVGGTSAGGNIAAVLAHIARDEGLHPPLTGQYLAIPAIGRDQDIPAQYQDRLLSWGKYRDNATLTVASINAVLGMYEPDVKDYRFNIVNHPEGHERLPPAYFQVAGGDPLRDQALVYETILRENQISTKLDIYPGLPHGFWSAFPSLTSSRKFRREQVGGIGWLLGVEKAVDESDQAIEFDRQVSIRLVTKLWLVWTVACAKFARLWRGRQ